MDRDFVLLKMEHSQFSIYAKKGNNLVYQIQSNSFDKAELLAYPSKQFVGKLQHHKNGKVREVAFEVFDSQTRRWQKSKLIYKSISWIKDKVDIEWNGQPSNYIHESYGVAGRLSSNRLIPLWLNYNTTAGAINAMQTMKLKYIPMRFQILRI
jgi:hypothetical protein